MKDGESRNKSSNNTNKVLHLALKVTTSCSQWFVLLNNSTCGVNPTLKIQSNNVELAEIGRPLSISTWLTMFAPFYFIFHFIFPIYIERKHIMIIIEVDHV